MGVRQFLDDRLDAARFVVDRQRLDYQPMPWLGIRDAPRSAGVHSRWQRMVEVARDLEVASAVDVGCNVGFYVVGLARRGIATVGIEEDARYARVLARARARLELETVGVMVMRLTPQSVSLVPHTDATLLLAVWHHLVRDFGLQRAKCMIGELWAGTSKVMFFETGQAEMPATWGLPEMGPEPTAFIANMLGETCSGSRVEYLGDHDAFDAQRRPCRRGLFAVTRV